jgi:extracellular elastinolytic metalloproteinase
VSFKGASTATTQESGTGLVFNFPPDFTVAPTTTENVNTAHVNAFYVVNTVHDISYKYGFTEAAFKYVILLSSQGPFHGCNNFCHI